MLEYRPICVKNNTFVNRKRYESGRRQTFVPSGPDFGVSGFSAEIATF